MIKIYVSTVDKSQQGKTRKFGYTDGHRRKIPKNAVYLTHNGHSPRCGAGCGADDINNYVYWDKDLNIVLKVRHEYHLTWHHVEDDVPKGVITQHRKALAEYVEEQKSR